MAYTQILYHIVFSTKNREKVLIKEKREDLFKYTWGILKNHKCHLYRINGVDDHIHILSNLHPTIALSDLIKDIKVASSIWIKENNIFPKFNGWQKSYGGFTYSFDTKDILINYVKNQEEHHKTITFEEEFISLLNEHGIDYDKKYLFK